MVLATGRRIRGDRICDDRICDERICDEREAESERQSDEQMHIHDGKCDLVTRETLIKCRQEALTTGCTGVHGGPRGLNQNFPSQSCATRSTSDLRCTRRSASTVERPRRKANEAWRDGNCSHVSHLPTPRQRLRAQMSNEALHQHSAWYERSLSSAGVASQPVNGTLGERD